MTVYIQILISWFQPGDLRDDGENLVEGPNSKAELYLFDTQDILKTPERLEPPVEFQDV